MQLTRRDFVKATALAAGVAALPIPTWAAEAPKEGGHKPNIIMILLDDMGWGDPACFGHPYMKTPNIDRLAKEGTMFTQFYVNSPVCSPSRVAFMTGQYPARNNVHHIYGNNAGAGLMRGIPDYLDPAVPVLPSLLKAAGYATGHFGKWHLSGREPNAPMPDQYGIDDYKVFCAGNESWPAAKNLAAWSYRSTDDMVDETIRFVDANKDKPFYVNLWTLVPHTPLKPSKEQLAEYAGIDPKLEDFPPHMRKYLARAKNLKAQMQTYCAAMTGLDKAIGRLLDHLDKTGLAKDTLILFTSDNGPEDFTVGSECTGSPGEQRGRKRSIYDGGVRTSCIARWPGHIPAGRKDSTSILTGVDWLPTVCALTGAKIPDVPHGMDGENITDILSGKTRERTKPIFWEWKFEVLGDKGYKPPSLAVREGKWKFFMNADGSRKELYDILADPEEVKNVAGANPDLVMNMAKQLAAWKQTLPNGVGK